MSDWFWKKFNYLAGLIAIIFLFGLTVLMANIEIKDLDLWLHLATGRYIIQHLTIPTVDILSCTISGQPWINHEWLFQVLVYIIQDLFGFDGLGFLQVILVVLTFGLLLFLGYDGERQLISIASLLLVLLVYQIRFTLRPDLFSLLFFSLYVYMLGTQLEEKKAIIFLCLAQVLWSNMHGFFILGPLLVLLMLIGEYLKRRFVLPFDWSQVGRLSDFQYRQLKKIFLFISLSCLINPYFIKGALYPLGVLFSVSGDSRIFFQYIGELKRPITLSTLLSFQHYGTYKALIILSFLSFLGNFRKINISTFLFCLMMLLFSLIATRNIPFFAFASYFVILTNAHQWSWEGRWIRWFQGTRWQEITSSIIKVLLIIWMGQIFHQLNFRGYFDFDRFEQKSEFGGISLYNFPYRAVDFLMRHNVRGDFFNDFNSGSYLLGRTHPQVRVFIDGRTEVYGAQFFEQYRQIMAGDMELFEKLVHQHHLSGVFLGSVYGPPPRELLKHLNESPQWVLVYFDYDAIIFLRNIPQNQQWIRSLRVDLAQWQSQGIDLLKLGARNVTPYRYLNRAKVLFLMEYFDKVLAEAKEALRIAPDYVEAYKLSGRVYLKQEKYADAFENLRKAKVLDVYDLETRYYLAMALFHLNEDQQAETQCERILERDPKNAKTLFLLSRIYAKQQKHDQAWQFLQKIPRDAVKDIDDLSELGMLLIKQEAAAWAQKFYEWAVAIDPKNEDLRRKLGNIHE